MTEEAALTPSQLAAMIDHTFLKAFGSPQDVEKICNEARMYGFCTAMVNPAELDRVVRLVQGSDVLPATVIGFPLGQNTPPVKEFEAKDAIDRGARREGTDFTGYRG